VYNCVCTYLWAEAAMTTVYVHNKSPHQVLENKTPEEMFLGDKLEVIDLRIFGCPVYVHVPKDENKVGPIWKERYIFWVQ
jgi:hypothetical protein